MEIPENILDWAERHGCMDDTGTYVVISVDERPDGPNGSRWIDSWTTAIPAKDAEQIRLAADQRNRR
jgi:hypothetical protein